LIDFAVRRFGHLDVMVNNAGLVEVINLSEADWKLNIDIMATGVFPGSRTAARQLIAQGDGRRIITVASQAGKTGVPMLAAYCAAKFAALGFTEALAQELGPHNITLNAVCPGTVDTALLAVRSGVYERFSALAGISPEECRRRLLRYISLGRLARPEAITDVGGFPRLARGGLHHRRIDQCDRRGEMHQDCPLRRQGR
jgi:NAD(P)-dependent dehydrogenase (short-subunit alcohol dehydrogenase family)